MTFLNSALLAALSLGLIPILIHLLNRQRFKEVDFPTLRFLQEMQRQKMRRVRVRQWILLLLRTLAVLALVLAMARPVLRSEASLIGGGDARASVVLVLDRTASMNAESPGGTRFRELQVRAQELVQALGSNDDIQIVWSDSKPVLFPDAPTQHKTLIRDEIEAATVTESGGSITDAIGVARSILGQSQNLLKEVYVLSDFSGSVWPSSLPQTPILPDDVRLYVLNLAKGNISNVGIASATITSRLIAPGRPVELSFTVANSGNDDRNDRIIGVYLDGKRVAQTRLSIRAGETRTESIRFVPESVGDLTGYVRLEDTDEFPNDDVCRYVLRVPARLNTAIVGADAPARRLLALALDPSGRGESFVHTLELLPAQLEGEDWSAFDAIFVVDAPAFSSAFSERARAYLQTGRGMFVAGGPNFDIRAHASWMQEMGLPVPTDVEDFSPGGIRWTKVDLEHPLFEGIFQDKPVDISPTFMRLFALAATPSGASTIIEGTGGLRFLVEATQGRGRVLFLTGSPDPEWSTMYRAGVFSPLMTGSAAYLAGFGESGSQLAFTVGEDAELILRDAEQLQYDLVKDDQSFRLTAAPVSGGQSLRIPPIQQTGEYRLMQNSKLVRPVVINTPKHESDVALSESDSQLETLGGDQSVLAENQNIELVVREGRYGHELWKMFLMIALALLVAEMLIARTPKQESLAPQPA
ncbi:MAG: BatA domain-containing protein [Calditrichaeota bacterium]|nr:BatA domain-containing protein [Calditrichota bacterium]MCB9367977.1 BatA domain-containing protein [Calditrichota bacterium]